MWTFWGGILLQVIGGTIGGAILSSLSGPYSSFTGRHFAGFIIAAAFMVIGITFMLRGLREYFLADITSLLRKMTTNAKE